MSRKTVRKGRLWWLNIHNKQTTVKQQENTVPLKENVRR
jgi:hypothetical protein